MKNVAVIMAGGSGERFWPLSRITKPKQMLALTPSGQMMINEAIERISPLIPPEDIYIITSAVLLDSMRKAAEALPPENIIAEPHKRNTAPCLALSAAFISEKYAEFGLKSEDIVIAVLTADQMISPVDKFIETVAFTLNYVYQNKVIATIGIEPNRPETGYGYIEADGNFEGINIVIALPVRKFHEKPDIEKAKDYIERGNFLWNSGMFFWRLDVFIEAMIKYAPEIGSKIDVMAEKYRNKTNIALPEPLTSINEIFHSMPDISIDYALMEKAENVVVVKALFDWDDIGAWDALERFMTKDENSNIIIGNIAEIDSRNSIIFNESKDRIVAGIGLENFVVINTDDATLICPKNRVQEIKKIVEKIRKDFKGKWL